MSGMRGLIRLVEAASTPVGTIEGLPDDVTIHSRQINELLGSGRFRLLAKPGRRNHYTIEVHPLHPGDMETYKPRVFKDVVAYHDAAASDLHSTDDEDIIRLTYPKLKPGYTEKIDPLPGSDIIYRGMSFEEYEYFLEHHQIESNGNQNIGNAQRGLTYWATDPVSAVSYANAFAPAAFKPSFKHPCYVMATHKPAETRHVDGVGSHEVGVARPIRADEIIAIWEGRVYAFKPGDISLRPHAWEDHHEAGGSSAPSISVFWHRIS